MPIHGTIQLKSEEMKTWLTGKLKDSAMIEKLQSKAVEAGNAITSRVENSVVLGKVNDTIGDGKEWLGSKLDSSEVYNAMHGKLEKGIEGAFESVISRRKNQPKSLVAVGAGVTDIDALIARYARENATISGAAGLIPGPWGMVAVVPEIAAVIKNQIEMVYDIGVANGKQAQITKELLAGIVMSAIGTSASSLLVMHGSKVLVKRSSLRVFQKIVSMLAGKVTQQAVKASISKWLPIVGAAFMAWLSAHLTNKIGKLADEVFSKEIEITDVEVSETEIFSEASADAFEEPSSPSPGVGASKIN